MRTFAYKKLVRDKIVEDVIKTGGTVKYKILKRTSYFIELKRKLLEEAKELINVTNLDEMLNELADIQEIIDNLLAFSGNSKQKLIQAQKSKNQKKGSFKKMHYIDHVSVADDSAWADHFLKRPDQYPEIKI